MVVTRNRPSGEKDFAGMGALPVEIDRLRGLHLPTQCSETPSYSGQPRCAGRWGAKAMPSTVRLFGEFAWPCHRRAAQSWFCPRRRPPAPRAGGDLGDPLARCFGQGWQCRHPQRPGEPCRPRRRKPGCRCLGIAERRRACPDELLVTFSPSSGPMDQARRRWRRRARHREYPMARTWPSISSGATVGISSFLSSAKVVRKLCTLIGVCRLPRTP